MKTQVKIKAAELLKKLGGEVPVSFYVGPKGERGDPGASVEGPRGIQGEKGDKGDRGERGEQGIQGLRGEKGDDGKDLPKLLEELEKLKKRIYSLGGGNANRNIQVGGNNVLSPYTDINLKAGTNVILSAVANNTTKYTDVTISGSASGATLTPETPTGTVNGANVTFTVTHTPVQLFTDGMLRVSVADYVYATGTITMNALLAPTQSIISYYNA